MSKKIMACLLLGYFLISGCATTGAVKDTAAGYIIYTNASKDVAFKASCQALEKLKYIILVNYIDNFLIEGFYSDILTGRLNIRIEIDEEAGMTKITYNINQPGTIKAFDITGYYPRNASRIYNAIADKLGEQGYVLQKK